MAGLTGQSNLHFHMSYSGLYRKVGQYGGDNAVTHSSIGCASLCCLAKAERRPFAVIKLAMVSLLAIVPV